MIRRGLSGLLATLILAMGVVAPLLDHPTPSEATHIESRHDPVSCPQGHDHRICTHQGPVHWILAAPVAVVPPPSGVGVDDAVSAAAPILALLLEGHPSRAPPRI